MIASSLKQRKKRNVYITEPINGVESDLRMFKRKFKDTNIHYIETSRPCKILLPRIYIRNWLLNKFQQSAKDVYLFYSGHGGPNGDWYLDTYENPLG